MHLSDIYRHPVKGIGSERLDGATLSARRALPGDRIYALTHAKSDYAVGSGAWGGPPCFIHPTNLPKLANVTIRFDDATHQLHAEHAEIGAIDAPLRTAAGRAALAKWIAPLCAPVLPGPHEVAEAADGVYFGDVEPPMVSIHNRASLRALSQHVGQDLDPRRFRANLWIDGAAPWAEWDWIGREIRVGPARLRVVERIERCMATAANPETGERDALPVRALDGAFGHRDFGVLAEVIEGGEIAVGAPVSPPE